MARSPRADRKSTRLNSSHLGISYAVFCLKKSGNDYRCHLSFATFPGILLLPIVTAGRVLACQGAANLSVRMSIAVAATGYFLFFLRTGPPGTFNPFPPGPPSV